MRISSECVELVRRLGIPTIIEGNSNYNNNDMNHLARINKVHMLYLTGNILANKLEVYTNIIDTLIDVTTILSDNNIDYAVFKTLKPFPYLPSDIDMLIDPSDADKIVGLLTRYNYSMFIKDSLCITMKKHNINVDLYFDPCVSGIPYLSRESLVRNRTSIKIRNATIQRLADYAEFIAVACHSFYKEQMFTLSDYYTLTILAENSDVKDIIALGKENNCLDILYLISNICKEITVEVFDRDDLKICKIADMLANTNNFNNIIATDILTLPYKFPIRYVTISLFRKVAKEHGKINSLRYFAKSISFKQIKKLLEHIKRETY